MNEFEKRAEKSIREYGVFKTAELTKRMIDEGLSVLLDDEELCGDMKEAMQLIALEMKATISEEFKR